MNARLDDMNKRDIDKEFHVFKGLGEKTNAKVWINDALKF